MFPNGLQGTIILGNKYAKIFSALPEHYTVTDFDIHIEDSSKSFKDMETVKALNIELIKAGMSDPEMAVNIAVANSMTELKRYVDKAMSIKLLKSYKNKIKTYKINLLKYKINYNIIISLNYY